MDAFAAFRALKKACDVNIHKPFKCWMNATPKTPRIETDHDLSKDLALGSLATHSLSFS